MVDTVLIEVATTLPEWVFSWGHFAVLVGLLILVLIVVAVIADPKEDNVESITVGALCLSFLATLLWVILSIAAYGGDRVVPEPEAERVAAEISEVTGVPVTAEQVQDMEDGDYVPGVNYDRLTDSEGKLVFKVEVG